MYDRFHIFMRFIKNEFFTPWLLPKVRRTPLEDSFGKPVEQRQPKTKRLQLLKRLKVDTAKDTWRVKYRVKDMSTGEKKE